MKNAFSLILFLFLSILSANSQPQAYREFDDIDHSGIPITNFFQDENGQIWVCTQVGMYMYNGVKLQRDFGLASGNFAENTIRVRYPYKIDDTNYYMCSESGLYLFNIETYTFTLIPETMGMDIRVLAPVGNDVLLLGTMNGLLRLDLKNKIVQKVNEVHSSPTVSILLDDEKGVAYISSNNGFYEYNLSTQTYTFTSLPAKSGKPSLVHSMNYDKKHRSVWLGAEKKLYRYDLNTKEFEYKPTDSENTISCITVDSSGYIWVGTDNGVRTFNAATGQQENLIQGTRSSKYVVWAVFEDRKKNIWLGAETGLSVYRNDPYVQVLRWKNLAQSEEDNRLTCLYKDSRGNFWFGGANGLGRLAPGKQHVNWYKAEDPRFSISHNRTHSFYEDKDGDLWVGTDESVNRFDYQSERFTHYSIMDSAMIRKADWCHNIMEDEEGNLWIAAFMGGIFKVNKSKLIKQENHIYLAEDNYYEHAGKNGLSSDRVQATIRDKRGNIWASTNGHGLNKIDFEADSVVHFSSDHPQRKLSGSAITSLFCDKDGFIWVGYSGALDRIDPQTNEIVSIHHELFNGRIIHSIVEKDGYLWLTSSGGLYAFNKQNQGLTLMKLENLGFSCSFLDEETGRIYIGGMNQCVSFDPNGVLTANKEYLPVVFTSLFVNNEPIRVGDEYDGNKILTRSLPYADKITLVHDQNNISLEVTDIKYDQILKPQWQYKLDDVDKNWQALDMSTNRISYHNLHPGKYTLTVQQIDEMGNGVAVRRLTIHILFPWYATALAKGIYLILFLAFLVWIINYFRVKNNLKIARVEKEKALELSAMKIEFLSNVSHELKTPLSLIISPANKLLTTTKNSSDKKLVQTIQQNAMRLSTLVNQMIDSKNLELSEDILLLSRLEVVEFCKSIFHVYHPAFQAKGVTLTFETDTEELYINVDVIKLESILNNLISNAFKFTKEGDSVYLKLDYQQADNTQLMITVADTGIGIPQKDLPFIFNRFYQSDANTHMNKEGSGIGLSMVKKYVEMHNGIIKASSEEQRGTSISLILPIETQPEQTISDMENEDASTPLSGIKVLVVEDNVDIARFITDNLKDVNCRVAHNGSSGFEIAVEWHPDIIISDVMMPVMGGIEMSRLLKQNIETATIPIVLLTAKNDKQTENLAYSIGVEAFIPKPFDIKQLMLRIEQIRRNKSLLISKIKQSSIIEDKEIVAESQDEKLLAKITQIIEGHLDDSDLNVQKLSDLSGINTKQIYRRIKLLTGHTAVDYIKSIRLKKAAMLLSQQKFSIGEVMYMVGFSNPSYFSKCFSEKYGKTPKQYLEEVSAKEH